MTIIQANKFYFLKGGAERYLFDLTQYLESHGNTVVPFAMRHPDNLPTPYETYFPSYVRTERVGFGLNALRTVGRMLYSVEARRDMAWLIAHAHPDLAHVHNIYTQLSPSILQALSEKRIPVVMTVHDHHLISPQYNIWAPLCGPDYRNVGIVRGTLARFHKHSYAASFMQVLTYKLHRALRIYEKNVNIFIAPSEYMQRMLIAGGFPKEKIRVNHYGIQAESFTPRFDHDGYFLFVGRLSEEKGVEMVLRLAKLLPDLKFEIVGTGPEEEKLHRMGHALHNVEFVGFKNGDALHEAYRGAIGVLVPSRVQEVFPLTILEAMAFGKPVVASAVGGVPEVVEDRVTGFLAHPTDMRAWVEAVMRLAYDDAHRMRMAREARLKTETTFHVRHHWERLLRIYNEAKT